MLRIAIAIAVVVAATEARADVCTTNQSSFDAVQQLEEIAKNPKVKQTFPEYGRCLPKLRWDQKLHKRAAKACETILAATANHRACIDYSASRGERKVGTVDIAAAILARPLDPWKLYSGHGGPDGEIDETYSHLVRLQLTSVNQLMMDVWNEGTRRLVVIKKTDKNAVYTWTEWRKVAAIVLARLGGEDEKKFLEQQLDAVKKENEPKLQATIEAAIDALDR
jgi:hypothetical protein